MEFHERLYKIRKVNKLTQAEVAHRCNMAVRTYQNYESGMRTPRTDVIEKLCKVFEISNTVLMDDHSFNEYLKSKSSNNFGVQKIDRDDGKKTMRKMITLSAPMAPLVAGSLSLGPLGFPFMLTALGAAGFGTLLFSKMIKKDFEKKDLDNNLKALYKELSNIAIMNNNIQANAIPLNEIYTELAGTTQSDDAKIEDYKKFLQLNKAVTLFQKITTVLLNKERLCQKAIDYLETVPFQPDAYNSCIEEILLVEKDQRVIIEEINKEMLDLKNKGFFDNYEELE